MVALFRRRRPLRRNGLVLAGGGARGAYQAGVLAGLAEIAPRGPSPFSVVAGVSVGAINAAGLAAGALNFQAAAEQLDTLWSALSTDQVFCTNPVKIGATGLHWLSALLFGGFGVANPDSLLDNTPLKELLDAHVDFAGVDHAIRSGTMHALGVTASSYTTGRAVTFFQAGEGAARWSRARRAGRPAQLTTAHLMASAALPFVFPARRIGGGFFGDGALRLTAPLSPAIRMGADRLFVIGGRDERIGGEPAETAHPHAPSLGQLAGYMLDIAFNDNLQADLERLERINATLAQVPEGRREETGLKPVDVFVIRPSRDIRDIAGEHAAAMPWAVKNLIRGLGAWGPPWVLPSYLLFEPGYLGALIALGRKDVLARREEAAAFLFGAEPSARPDSAALDRRRGS